VRDGRLTPEQAESHPQRAIVTRALGVDTEVDVDLYPIEVVSGDRALPAPTGSR
jgi:protein phosphatase